MTVGRVAGNSGQHTVSPAPNTDSRRAGSRERLDRPAAYTPRLDVLPIPFGEFYAAVFTVEGRRRDAFRLVEVTRRRPTSSG
jgi:hypothetical protein